MIRAGVWRFALRREGEVLRLHRVESRIVGGKVEDHMVDCADKSGTAHEIAVYLHGIDPKVSMDVLTSTIEGEMR